MTNLFAQFDALLDWRTQILECCSPKSQASSQFFDNETQRRRGSIRACGPAPAATQSDSVPSSPEPTWRQRAGAIGTSRRLMVRARLPAENTSTSALHHPLTRIPHPSFKEGT